MATYYVRKTGNNANLGTSPAQAWLTIDYAASTVAAGDTVYIGAGQYNEGVTMDTSGAAGSLISYIGDVDGANTGDAGPVIINGADELGFRYQSTPALSMNAKDFILFENLTFDVAHLTLTSSGSVVASGNSSSEGVEFRNCTFSVHYGKSQSVEWNFGTASGTPATTGLTFTRCLFFYRGIEFLWAEGAAEINLKIVFDRCVFFLAAMQGIRIYGDSSAGAQPIGGITVKSCTFITCAYGIGTDYSRSINFPVICANNLFYLCQNSIVRGSSSVANSVISNGGNVAYGAGGGMSNVTYTYGDIVYYGNNNIWFSGIHDMPFRQKMGWSPLQFLEQFTRVYIPPPNSKRGIPGELSAATQDFYGNPINSGGTSILHAWIDGSDDPITDPNSVWVSETNITDNDLESRGYTTNNGSDILNYVHAGGDNFYLTGNVTQVRVRAKVEGIAANATGSIRIYTDGLGEVLGTINVTVFGISETAWLTLTPPAGGWTTTNLAALEFKSWRDAGAGSWNVYMVQLEATVEGTASDLGAIQNRNRLDRDNSVVYDGTYSARFDGAGWHDFIIPVQAALTTIRAYARYDGSYGGGDLPQMIIMNIPGLADQTDTMTAAANTWEQLSIAFTPTSSGWVRVRLKSRDNSNGHTYFDLITQA